MRISALVGVHEPWFRIPNKTEFELFKLMGSKDEAEARLAVEDFFNIFNALPQAREGLIENLKDEVKPFLLKGPVGNEQTQRMYNLLLKSSISLILLPELLIDEDIIANPDLAQEISASFYRSQEQAHLKGGFEEFLEQLGKIEVYSEIDQRLLGEPAEEQEVVDGF